MALGQVCGKGEYADIVKDLEKVIPKDKIFVAAVEMGSRIWGMQKSGSDRDILIIYAEPTVDILSGRVTRPSMPNKHGSIIEGRRYDFSFVEIGVLVNRIKKGEITAIWSTTSPIVYRETSYYTLLTDIVKRHPIKGVCPSLIGMARGNLAGSESSPTKTAAQKKIAIAYRNALFGGVLLTEKRYDYGVPVRKVSETEVMMALDNLEQMYFLSSLPDQYDPHELEQYLLDFRKAFL
jgi:predicted nucleotidyltransferase